MSGLDSATNTVTSWADFLTKRIVIVGAVLVALLLSLTFFVKSIPSPFAITSTTEIQSLLLGSIQAESLLTTASQDVTANVKINKVATALGVPIGSTNLVYSAVGKATAGLPLHDIEVVAFDQAMRTVALRLPAVELDVSLNPERSETLANYRSWFGPKAGADIYEEAQRQAYGIMSHKACDGKILQAATRSAEAEIRTILTKAGFEQVTFETTASHCSAV